MTGPAARRDRYDVVVVGGGHNGLTAAAYLAGAGLSVAVLERLDHSGGAAVSAQAFPGFPTRLSRYSYLVSLLPEAIVGDLGLDLRLASRATASYTPVRRDGVARGLLVERPEGPADQGQLPRPDRLRRRVRRPGATSTQQVGEVAAAVAPTLTAPLPRPAALRPQVDPVHLAGPGRAAAGRGRRAPLPRRDGARRGRHRRADRHLRPDETTPR